LIIKKIKGMKKQISIEEAVGKIKSGMTIMCGGFLSNGSALKMLDALSKTDVKDLTLITNDTSYDNVGVGKLFTSKMIKKVIVSYIGSNKTSQQQIDSKEIEVEFVPQGTLAERIRTGGFGMGGFLSATGLGTLVAKGKRIIKVDDKEYILELPLHADVALIGASKGDESGNLVYYGTSQNFNPLMASAADIVIAEIDEIVSVGDIKPEAIHTPGILINYIVK